MPWPKIFPALILLAMWGGIGWAILRRKRIERELVADNAVPAPAPRALLYVVLSGIVAGFSGLMLYFIFG